MHFSLTNALVATTAILALASANPIGVRGISPAKLPGGMCPRICHTTKHPLARKPGMPCGYELGEMVYQEGAQTCSSDLNQILVCSDHVWTIATDCAEAGDQICFNTQPHDPAGVRSCRSKNSNVWLRAPKGICDIVGKKFGLAERCA